MISDLELWRLLLKLQAGGDQAAEASLKLDLSPAEALSALGDELHYRGMLMPGEDPVWDKQRAEREHKLEELISCLPPEDLGAYLMPAVSIEKYTWGGEIHGQLAGAPYWPAEKPWPTREDQPLVLVLQIDLGSLPPFFQKLTGFPEDGWLSIFHDVQSLDYFEAGAGWWPDDLGCSQVHIFSKDEAKERAPIPEELRKDYRKPFFLISKAGVEDRKVGDVLRALDSEELDLIEADSPLLYSNKLLGMPNPIQGEVEEECPLLGHGRDSDPPLGQPDLRQDRSEDWRLLLQLDRVGPFAWGDLGLLYVMVPAESLAEGGTDCWTIMQCH